MCAPCSLGRVTGGLQEVLMAMTAFKPTGNALREPIDFDHKKQIRMEEP